MTHLAISEDLIADLKIGGIAILAGTVIVLMCFIFECLISML